MFSANASRRGCGPPRRPCTTWASAAVFPEHAGGQNIAGDGRNRRRASPEIASVPPQVLRAAAVLLFPGIYSQLRWTRRSAPSARITAPLPETAGAGQASRRPSLPALLCSLVGGGRGNGRKRERRRGGSTRGPPVSDPGAGPAAAEVDKWRRPSAKPSPCSEGAFSKIRFHSLPSRTAQGPGCNYLFC